MDPAVLGDPIFRELLVEYENTGKKLRDAVIALRSFCLRLPLDQDSVAQQWKVSNLSDDLSSKLVKHQDAAAQLVRYGFELSAHSNDPAHIAEITKLRAAHFDRLLCRPGSLKDSRPVIRGIEEKIDVNDGGPPVTIVIKPQHYDLTDRAKRSSQKKQ